MSTEICRIKEELGFSDSWFLKYVSLVELSVLGTGECGKEKEELCIVKISLAKHYVISSSPFNSHTQILFDFPELISLKTIKSNNSWRRFN